MGTAFIVFVPEPRLGADKGLLFLVTNRHLIREPDQEGVSGAGPFFQSISARVNRKIPLPNGRQYIQFILPVVDQTGSLQWFVPKDKSVDLAVTPIQLRDDVDFKSIPVGLFATSDVIEREQVTENDEVLFAGLFAWHPGVRKNYPIVRHGKLARLLEEPIPINRYRPEETIAVHLAEVLSFGGNSGSPVFLRLGGISDRRTLAGYRYFLLGVMQGFFPETADLEVRIAELKRGTVSQNSGLAAVVPADKLKELLETPRAQAYIERVVALHLQNIGQTDAAEQAVLTAIKLLETSSPSHSDLASALEVYARILKSTNRHEQARPVEARSTNIRNVRTADLMNPQI